MAKKKIDPLNRKQYGAVSAALTVTDVAAASPAMGRRSAKNVGASPASLYIYVENVDKVVEKATKLGATPQGPVLDMFWGDRCGTVVDPDGYNWMVGTHKAEPSAKEMKKGMEEIMKQQPPATAAAD
jgi:PhnB protein